MVSAMADPDTAVEFIPADLAPGDGKALELDCRDLDVVRVHSIHEPLFVMAYERLWNEFGPQHEMAWNRATAIGNCWLRYELLLVRRQGQFVAVRDHTAVTTCGLGAPHAVVHLSHVLVEPAWRRTGLAGWLRAWPIQTARACLAAAGFPAAFPITLVAEMEHPDPQFPNRLVRLAAYEKAGFKKVDPKVVNYFQPDFRPSHEIDASGGPRPLPFGLIVRRVGREEEQTIRGSEVREIVECLYRMYGTGFREQDMAALWQSLREYPHDEANILLVAPTQSPTSGKAGGSN
jgi:GNAT superfamily N-acetyltransferase